MKIPEGTQTGKIFRLRGKGITSLQGYGKGDELVVLRVETPANLSSRQKELLEEFAHLSGEDVNPHNKNFFDKVKDMFS